MLWNLFVLDRDLYELQKRAFWALESIFLKSYAEGEHTYCDAVVSKSFIIRSLLTAFSANIFWKVEKLDWNLWESTLQVNAIN